MAFIPKSLPTYPVLPDPPPTPSTPPLTTPQSRAWMNLYRRTQRPPKFQQTTVSAEEKAIKICYGRCRIGAEVIWIGRAYSDWIFHLRWCWGEIWKINKVQLDDLDLPSGSTITNYLGTTTQGVDPTLQQRISGYTDTLVANINGEQKGIAYSVVVIPYEVMRDSLQFTADIDGLIVYDPRSDNMVYSTNPALQAGDFLTSSFYGPNWAMDLDSIKSLADMNDELVSGTKRYESHMIIDLIGSVHEYAAVLASAAGAFIVPTTGGYKFQENRPRTTQETFDLRAVSINRSTRVVPLNRQQKPNTVRVRYTSITSRGPWAEKEVEAKTADVQAGLEAQRLSVIRAPYIHDHRIANRLAVETLNSGILPTFDVTWIHADDGIRLERGDVITLDRIPGFTGPRDVRVLRKDMERTQEGYYWRITAREYDPLEYSDSVVDDPAPEPIDADDPLNPTPVSTLAVVEAPWLDAGGTYQTRLDITWDGVNHAQVLSYRVKVSASAGVEVIDEFVVQHQGTDIGHACSSSALEVGKLYTIEVFSISSLGVAAAPDTEQITATGDVLGPPPDVAQPLMVERLWVSDDGQSHSALDISWTGVDDPWVRSYRVEVTTQFGDIVDENAVVHRGAGVTHSDAVLSVEQGIQYIARIRAINVEGDYSLSVNTANITPQGRTQVPADVTNLDVTEYAEFVELNWDNVLGEGDNAYRIKRGLPGESWQNAARLDITLLQSELNWSGPRVVWRDYDTPEGTYDYLVKAVSFEGLESANAAIEQISIREPRGSFAQERPRPPTGLNDPKSAALGLGGYDAIRDNLLGMMETDVFTPDPDWQDALYLQNMSGVLYKFAASFQFQSYSSGTVPTGIRVILDDRIIYEYFNEISKTGGSPQTYLFVPVGQLFLNDASDDIVGMADAYFPFNESIRLQILVGTISGSMTIFGNAGWRYDLT